MVLYIENAKNSKIIVAFVVLLTYNINFVNVIVAFI